MKKNGIIQSLNVSRKGFYEGFLLGTGSAVIQINFPEDHQDFGDNCRPDAEISVEAEPEEPRGIPEHSVFRMVRAVGNYHREPKEKSNASRKFSGRIARLNYALHGEVNGGILGSGDFLHLKPEGARAIGLKTGMIVGGKGKTKPMVGGRFVIKAEEVNGIAIEHNKAKKKHNKSTMMDRKRLSLRGLDWVNFFMADVNTGIGPFLAIYLTATRHWDPASVGMVVAAQSIASVLAQTGGLARR